MIGGILIGLASLLGTVVSHKIPGISGVFGRLLMPETSDKTWRAVFLLGLIAAAAVSFLVAELRDFSTVAAALDDGHCRFAGRFRHEARRRLHQRSRSCGVGIKAKDSIVATLIFMAAAILTVFIYNRFA